MCAWSASADGRLRVALADDHATVREALRRLLESDAGFEVVAEAGDGMGLLGSLAAHAVDVALMDFDMPGLGGMELIRRVHAEFPKVGIVVLSMQADTQFAVSALDSGAQGYVAKDLAAADLRQAIRRVASGGVYVVSRAGNPAPLP
jgi:DNA-binding NarL/FixJ family response regulator